MAWIEAHQALGDHPKVRKLARLLQIDNENEPIGILLRLWWWAMDYAPDGAIGKYDAEELAWAMRWKGDPEKLLEALIGAGWIDDGPEGLQIHDWYQYAGRLVDMREAKREQDRIRQQRRRDREKERAASSHANVTRDVTRDGSDVSRPNIHNLPNQTDKTDQTIQTERDPAAAGSDRSAPCPFSEIVDLFNTICSSFPKVKSITESRKKAIGTRWREVQSLDAFREIFTAAEASPFLKGSNDRGWRADFDWILKPANWTKISEGNYKDRGTDPDPPQRPKTAADYVFGFKE